MKNLPLFKILLILCLLFPTISSGVAEKTADQWRIVGYTKYRDAVFADISRITVSKADTKDIWVKIAPAGRSKYLLMINEYLETVNKSGKGFKAIEILCEINCSSHLIRFARFVYFDNAGNVLHTAEENKPDRFLIVQGDIWNKVEMEACPQAK